MLSRWSGTSALPVRAVRRPTYLTETDPRGRTPGGLSVVDKVGKVVHGVCSCVRLTV